MIVFTNKVAVVTGAANGLGKALAAELSAQGCSLALLDIDADGLEDVKSRPQADGRKVSVHTVDVSQEYQIMAARTDILRLHQRIDILINNAGISISLPFSQLDLTDYKRLFDINFWGTVYCTKHFLPDLLQQADSRLVNVISDFALMGFPGKTAYASSKSAVMGFAYALQTELADTTVKVSLVIPPPLDTGLVKNSLHVNDSKRQNEAAFLERYGMPLDKAARKIIAGVKRGKYRIVVGPMMYWIDVAARLLPTTLHKLIGRNKKRFDFV